MAKTVFTDGVTAVVAAWLNKVFDHVHDGADEDGSVSKIDLEENIDYGAHGYLTVPTDDAATHEIQHVHSGGGDALFRGQFIRATGAVLTDLITTAVGALLPVEIPNISTEDIRATEAAPINIWESDGETPGAITLGMLIADDVVSPQTIRARARVTGSSRSDGNPLTYINSVGVDESQAQGSSAGVYNIKLSTAAANANHISAHVSLGQLGMAQATVVSSSVLQVRTFDASGTPTDRDFSLQVYY